jgi:hypothetical protein
MYSECVPGTLFIQHAKRIRRTAHVLMSEACLALPYFSTLSFKRHDFFVEKVTEHKKCVMNFSTSFVRNIFCSKKNSARRYNKFT